MNNTNNNVEDFEKMSKSEAGKFLAWFDNEYKVLYPPPIKRKAGKDWRFWASLITSVATVLLASLRTAQMFYNAAETSAITWGLEGTATQGLSFIDALVSIVAVEGGLAVIAAIRSQHRATISDRIYLYQIGILLAISIMAGLGQSIGLVQGVGENVLYWFSLILSVILGIGASCAAWFSGEVLGVLLNIYSMRSEEVEAEFSRAMESYRKVARTFWKQKKSQESSKKVPENSENLSKNRESSEESSGKFPQVSRPQKVSSDWRKVYPKLSHAELVDLANLKDEDIDSIAEEMGVVPKTIQNWRRKAQEKLDDTTLELDNGE